MNSRRFSKAVAAAILAVSVLATGSTAPAGAATDKAPSQPDQAARHRLGLSQLFSDHRWGRKLRVGQLSGADSESLLPIA